jgi:hypothetical protein
MYCFLKDVVLVVVVVLAYDAVTVVMVVMHLVLECLAWQGGCFDSYQRCCD